MLIHLIAAARPNFMKIAPLYHALKREHWAVPIIVHTGQHYDLNMSNAFFEDLGLPGPDLHLAVGSGTHAEQTGQVMIAYEKNVPLHQISKTLELKDEQVERVFKDFKAKDRATWHLRKIPPSLENSKAQSVWSTGHCAERIAQSAERTERWTYGEIQISGFEDLAVSDSDC